MLWDVLFSGASNINHINDADLNPYQQSRLIIKTTLDVENIILLADTAISGITKLSALYNGSKLAYQEGRLTEWAGSLFKNGSTTAITEGLKVGDQTSLGQVVTKPNINIEEYTIHGLNQKITRQVPTETVLQTVRSPKIVLQQSAGKYLFATDDAVVVTNSNGKVITVYGKNEYQQPIKDILQNVK